MTKLFTFITTLAKSFFNFNMLSCKAPFSPGFTLIYLSDIDVICCGLILSLDFNIESIMK